LRTGPLVRRGANASRIVPGAPATLRRAGLARSSELPVFGNLPLPSPIIEASCLHAECKLPINLRNFLARQFGPALESDNESILDMAATADPATLSKVARAIRRYSTSRAREAWAECAVTIEDFERKGMNAAAAARLCLECARLEFGAEACEAHLGPRCLTVDLLPACAPRPQSASDSSMSVADRLQRQIEDFRALRAAFGLSHFDLDCYVTNRRVMFSWRPLGTADAAPPGQLER
jgi:hypothetical protein